MPTPPRQSVVIDRTKRMMKLKLWVLAPIVILLGAVALLYSVNYSVGFRTGILNKLSSKGLFCWTTEVQLALADFSKSGDFRAREENLDNTLHFSVPAPKCESELRQRLPAAL